MIAKELLLGSATVDVEEQRILVERDLWGNTQDDVLSHEGSTVNLVIRQPSLGFVGQHVLKVLHIARQEVPEPAY